MQGREGAAGAKRELLRAHPADSPLGNKTGPAGGSEDGQEGGGVSTLRSGALQVEGGAGYAENDRFLNLEDTATELTRRHQETGLSQEDSSRVLDRRAGL